MALQKLNKEQPKKERNARKLLMFVTMSLVAVVSLFTTGTSAEANILNMPKLDIISDGGVTIDPKYSFVPQVTSKTKLETFGGVSGQTWRNTTWSGGDKRVFRSIDVNHPVDRNAYFQNENNRIGAKYTNVGYYNGVPLDLKITVTGWGRWGDVGKVGTAARIGNISFERDNIAFNTQGFSYADTTWEYVRAGTNTRVPVSGYFTFSDIDVNQFLQFSGTTSENIDRFIIEDRNNLLKFSNVRYTGQKVEYKIYDTTDTDVNDKVYNHRHAFTFLYSDLGSFSLRWGTDWSKTTRIGSKVGKDRFLYANTTDYNAGEYLFFVINKPVRTVITKPVKAVNITNNLKVADTLKYTVKHTVPQEDPKFYHSSYVMTDTLDTALTNPKLVIKNADGTNVTSLFTTNITGNTVKATAKAGTLKASSFYGETYTFEIEGGVHRANLLKAVGSKASYDIKNKATVDTSGGKHTSNEVSTRIHKRILTVQHVDNETGKVIASNNESVFDGEKYSEKPRTDLKSGTNVYKPTSTDAKTGTISGNTVVEFRYDLPSTLKIDHVDDDSDKLIATNSRMLFNGEKYDEKPRADLKSNGDTYKPTSTESKTGTMKGDTNLEFRYTLPRVITINHIDKDSGKLIVSETKKLHDGDKYNIYPKTDLKKGTDTYVPVSADAQSGTINKKDVTLNFYYVPPRTLTIKHIDFDTGALITSETRRLHGGEVYEVAPRTDLKRGTFNYKPKSMTPQKGSINLEDVTLSFYYSVPKMTVGLQKIQIYTDLATTDEDGGLPSKVNFDNVFVNESALADFVGGKVKLDVFDPLKSASVPVYTHTFKIADMDSTYEFDLPTDYLTKDKKIDYTYKLSITDIGSKKYELVSSTATADTHGYTSSEKVLKNSDLTGNKLDYTGVVMTELETGKDLKEYKERFVLDVPIIGKQKTGYGFEASVTSTYTNDLKNLVDVESNFLVEDALIDSYLDYTSNSGMTKIGQVQSSNTVSTDGKTVKRKLVLPKVNMEQNTGYLFTNKQVADNDARIKQTTVDGGNKLYIPVWAEIQKYDYGFESKDSIGANHVSYEINRKIDVFAHMYHHVDSGTADKDEIIVRPQPSDDIDW